MSIKFDKGNCAKSCLRNDQHEIKLLEYQQAAARFLLTLQKSLEGAVDLVERNDKGIKGWRNEESSLVFSMSDLLAEYRIPFISV